MITWGCDICDKRKAHSEIGPAGGMLPPDGYDSFTAVNGTVVVTCGEACTMQARAIHGGEQCPGSLQKLGRRLNNQRQARYFCSVCEKAMTMQEIGPRTGRTPVHAKPTYGK